MIGHSEHIAHYKKGPGAWYWRPLRLAGRNVIGVYRGLRLVTVLGPHEVDAAWGLCSVRNLAAGAPRRLLENNSQQAIRTAKVGQK